MPEARSSCLGKLQLGVFFATWMLGATLPLAALVQSLWFRAHHCTALLACYYAYRALFPRGRWLSFHRWQRDLRGRHHYFRGQSVVLEEKAGAPAPGSSRLLCYHPHGILCCGWSVNGAISPELYPSEISYLGANALFTLPFISDMLSWYGTGPATKANMLEKMKKGDNLALLPGGFQEATLFRHGAHRVYIKKRAGFVKYALMHGYCLQPTYSFGEEMTYYALSCLQERLMCLNKWNIPTVVFFGVWWLPFMPWAGAEMHTVVGKPLRLPRIVATTKKQVAEWHGKYVDALKALFNRHKAKYAPGAVLEVL